MTAVLTTERPTEQHTVDERDIGDGRDGRDRRTTPHPGMVLARTWGPVAVVLAARVYRTWLLALAALAIAPVLLGWGSYVIKSGSMEPSISVGDVVLAAPVEAGDRIRVGRVYVFDDPSTSHERLMVHRVVERRDDGDFTSSGDANDVTDITPLPRGDIEARAVLLTPSIGLPLAWAQAGQWARVSIWVLLTGLAFLLAGRRLEDERPRWDRWRRLRDRLPHGRLLLAAPVAAVTGMLVLGLLVTGANATFTARTGNGSSTWKVGTLAPLPYTKAVVADSPSSYWMLDEASGTQGADRSGNNRPALMTGVTLGVTGALPHNPGTAVSLDGGTDRIVSGGAAIAAPTSFSVEMWFKKSAGDGGKLIGFESSQSVLSGTFDRTVFMRNNGRVVYGWSTSASQYVESPKGYADDKWHHLVVTVSGSYSSSSGRLYLDGQLVDSGNVSAPAAYNGWWRVGYGSLPSGGSWPSARLDADVDSVAVYNSTVLSAARVAAHYAAR